MFCLWKSPAYYCCGTRKNLGNNNLFKEPTLSTLRPNRKFRERTQNLFAFYSPDSDLKSALLKVLLTFINCLSQLMLCWFFFFPLYYYLIKQWLSILSVKQGDIFSPYCKLWGPLWYPLMKRENRNTKLSKFSILIKSIGSWRASRTACNRSSLSRLIYTYVL